MVRCKRPWRLREELEDRTAPPRRVKVLGRCRWERLESGASTRSTKSGWLLLVRHDAAGVWRWLAIDKRGRLHRSVLRCHSEEEAQKAAANHVRRVEGACQAHRGDA